MDDNIKERKAAYLKAYRQRPDVKARANERRKKNRATPEGKTRLAEASKRWRNTPKGRANHRACAKRRRESPLGRAKQLIMMARRRARKHNIPFDLDNRANDIADILQHGLCALSGLPFNLKGGRVFNSPSLDQKEPGMGYVWSNVQVVLDVVNRGKLDYSQDDYINICKAVVQHQSIRNL